MIHELRRRHLLMQSALAVVALGGVLLALQARQAIPAEDGTAQVTDAEYSATIPESFTRFGDLQVYAAIGQDGQVSLRLTDALQKPDVLLYLGGKDATDNALGLEVTLLGGVDSDPLQQFPLPEQADATALHLLLYSLAHQEVLASVHLEGGR